MKKNTSFDEKNQSASALAKALGGRKSGAGYIARCPAHDDRDPSLSIGESCGGKVLVHCHAGCSQYDVINALRARGVWNLGGRRAIGSWGKLDRPAPPQIDSDAERRTDEALAVWRGSYSAEATLVEDYLRSRGITVPSPPSIRFHPRLKHPSGGTWPVMVALVTKGFDGQPIGIHRTFLARDASGKASVDPVKMMLGPCRGGAVRLAPAGDVVMVGEGIETCLSAMQLMGIPACAALSVGGMRSLVLPVDVKDVIVLADGDEVGEAAAQDCHRRWADEGRRVRIIRPPWRMDFNDLLLRRESSREEAAR